MEILHSEYDYVTYFYHIIARSKVFQYNGRPQGFPLGGKCYVNKSCKIAPIHKHLKQFSKLEIAQYIGIAADEPDRLARLEGTNKVSLLAKYGYTEKMCLGLCREYGLLSPIYDKRKRGGCWFCPNQSCKDFAWLKVNSPALWGELEKLSHTENLVSQGFKYGKTFAEVDREVDRIIGNRESEKSQIRLFLRW